MINIQLIEKKNGEETIETTETRISKQHIYKREKVKKKRTRSNIQLQIILCLSNTEIFILDICMYFTTEKKKES